MQGMKLNQLERGGVHTGSESEIAELGWAHRLDSAARPAMSLTLVEGVVRLGKL